MNLHEIARKAIIKDHVREERRTPDWSSDIAIAANAVSIEVRERCPALFFPLDIEQLRAFIQLLPPGVLLGLSRIVLESGKQLINTSTLSGDFDPHLRRRGFEIAPSVFSPAIRGLYRPVAGEIRIFGFAVDPQHTVTGEQLLTLRRDFLETLTHEVAHHANNSRRAPRGRWVMRDDMEAERFAERLVAEWAADTIEPFLAELEYEARASVAEPVEGGARR